jgi:hypothetical protein
LLLVFPWIPDDLRCGTGEDVVDFAGGVGGADFVGVAVLGAGGDDGEGFGGDAIEGWVRVDPRVDRRGTC